MLQDLTQEDIDKFYRDFESMKFLKPNAVMRKASGLSSGNVSEYLNKNKVPSPKFINSFYEKVYKNSINVPRETEDSLTVANEEQGKYVKPKKAEAIDKDQVIADLAHTNRGLADELKEIKQRLKKLEQIHTTADVDLDMQLSGSAILYRVLEAIGEIGEGKRWKTGAEAVAVIRNRISQDLHKQEA